MPEDSDRRDADAAGPVVVPVAVFDALETISDDPDVDFGDADAVRERAYALGFDGAVDWLDGVDDELYRHGVENGFASDADHSQRIPGRS